MKTAGLPAYRRMLMARASDLLKSPLANEETNDAFMRVAEACRICFMKLGSFPNNNYFRAGERMLPSS